MTRDDASEWTRKGFVHERLIEGCCLQTYTVADGWVYRAFNAVGRLLGWTVSAGERTSVDARRGAEEWFASLDENGGGS